MHFQLLEIELKVQTINIIFGKKMLCYPTINRTTESSYVVRTRQSV